MMKSDMKQTKFRLTLAKFLLSIINPPPPLISPSKAICNGDITKSTFLWNYESSNLTI